MKKAISLCIAMLLFAAVFAFCCTAFGETAADKSDASAAETAESGNTEYADLVVYGNIWTAEDNGNQTVEAFAVKDGKYVCVGTKKDVAPYIKEGKTKIIDKTGSGLIIPGCTESHGHYLGVDAIVRMQPGYNLSYDQLLELLKKEKDDDPEFNSFLSWGLDLTQMPSLYDPDRSFAEEIEAVAPGIPVVFIDTGGHQALCNITALKKSGLLDGKNVRGGELWLTADEKPRGIVRDDYVPYVIAKTIDFSSVKEEHYKQACRNAADTLHKRGYTNYLDAYINYLVGEQFFKAVKATDKDGDLNLNVAACYTIRSYEAENYKDRINHAKELADRYHTEHFNPYNIKLFADGVTEALTGWILDEYEDVEKGTEHGNIVWTPEELKTLVKYANGKDLLVHTHTYGDAAVRAMIDAYIDSNKEYGKNVRNTLAHVMNITREDIRRAADNKIGIAENLIWHYNDVFDSEDDAFVVEALNAKIPDYLLETAYPMKSLIDNGILVSSSTDAPAGEIIEGNIQNVIEVATTGILPEAKVSPLAPEELLTVREALMCLTLNGAKQLGIEDKCGSIVKGKNADFVILDTNFLDYKGEELRAIHKAKIQQVYFEGKEVLNNESAAA